MDEIQLPRLGNNISGQWIAFRHKCWIDSLPVIGTRHLLALARRHGIVADHIVDVPSGH